MHGHVRSDFYVRCLNCLSEVRVRPPARCGGRLVEWSDGFGSRQSTEYCRYSSCPVCGLAFWLDDAQRTSRVAEQTPRDMAMGDAILLAAGWVTGKPVPFDSNKLPDHGEDFVRPANNTQLMLVLGKQGLTQERESYLRIHLWWRSNHSDRHAIEFDDEPISDSARTINLNWLLNEFESRPSEDRDIVIEAELLRVLGRFDEALDRMDMAVCAGATRALALHAQTLAGSRKVCIVREDDSVVIY